MTDQPATTPADDRVDMLDELEAMPATGRITWLVQRIGVLETQRDRALSTCVDLRADLAERDRVIEHLAADRDEARRERDEAEALRTIAFDNWLEARKECDEARAQAVQATTDADDLRARVTDLLLNGTAEAESYRLERNHLRARVEALLRQWDRGLDVDEVHPMDATRRIIADVRDALGGAGTDLVSEALAARVEAAVSTWPPGPRKGDVLRALDGGA